VTVTGGKKRNRKSRLLSKMARSSTDYPDDIWDRLDFVTVLKKRKIASKIKKTSDLVKCTFDDTLTLPGRRRQLKRSLIYSIKIPSFKYPLRLLWLKPCVVEGHQAAEDFVYEELSAPTNHCRGADCQTGRLKVGTGLGVRKRHRGCSQKYESLEREIVKLKRELDTVKDKNLFKEEINSLREDLMRKRSW